MEHKFQSLDTISVVKPSDRILAALSRRIGQELARTQRTMTTAESCTGGFIAKCLTDIAGSSAWFRMGLVTYSNAAKVALLAVPERTLLAKGAVSRETAEAMCRGALRVAKADIAVAVTGIAGPGGATSGKPVGTVWFGWAVKTGQKIVAQTAIMHFSGGRDAVRRKSVEYSLRGVLSLIQLRQSADTVYRAKREKTR